MGAETLTPERGRAETTGEVETNLEIEVSRWERGTDLTQRGREAGRHQRGGRNWGGDSLSPILGGPLEL